MLNQRVCLGCSSTIAAALAAAAPNDTIEIAAGIYKEDVNVGKAISLLAPIAITRSSMPPVLRTAVTLMD
jgi:hypothetical protein